MAKVRFGYGGFILKNIGTTSVVNPVRGEAVILGTVQEDETLTVDTSGIIDADGLGEFSYQWYADNVELVGETTDSLLLGDSLVGKSIKVLVSFIDGDGTAEQIMSSVVGPVANVDDAPVGVPIIEGTRTEDQTLTVNISGVSDIDGIGDVTYQWYRDNVAVSGETGISYLLGDADVGSVIRVDMLYTDNNGTPTTVSSADTTAIVNVNDAPSGTPVITGTTEVGDTLTADTSSIADADGLGTFSYQWYRNAVPVSGETTSTYTLTINDSLSDIHVIVSWTDGNGTLETVSSATTSLPYYPLNVSRNSERILEEDGYIFSVNGITGNYFSQNMDTDGTHVIIGDNLSDDPAGDSGVTYIFERSDSGSSYPLKHTLYNPNAYSTAIGDNFGVAVGISGNYAIVGAHQEDEAGAAGSGKAYIFDVTTGNLLHTLDNPNAYGLSTNDYFGRKVAISGNYAVVTAPYEDATTGSSSGAIYIYDVVTGNLLHSIPNPQTTSSLNTRFGWSVAMYNNNIIVGAHQGTADGVQGGAAYIYDAPTGNLILTLTNPNTYGTTSNDYFGEAVDICGNYAVVGAFREDSPVTSDSGAAYVFDITTGNLVHTLLPPSPDAFKYYGASVGISKNYVFVGEYESYDGGTATGAAHIFNLSDGTLKETVFGTAGYDDGAALDRFGFSIAASDYLIAVGSKFGDSPDGGNDGYAQLYYDKNYLNPQVSILNDATEGFGVSSRTIDISGDYFAVGCPEWSGSKGRVKLFNKNTGALVNTLYCPESTVNGDYFGGSLSIDGNLLAISATNWERSQNTSYYNEGRVWVFETLTGDWSDAALKYTIQNPDLYSTYRDDYFGSYVDLKNGVLAVSMANEGSYSSSFDNWSGAAAIFEMETGSLVAGMLNPNVNNGDYAMYDRFGSGASTNGSVVFFGAPGEHDSDGTSAKPGDGTGYIYDAVTGNLLYTFPRNTNTRSFGGESKMFGNTLAISTGYDSGSLSSGFELYDISNPSAPQYIRTIPSYGTIFDMNDKYVIYGDSGYDLGTDSNTNEGAIFVMEYSSGKIIATAEDPNIHDYPASDDRLGSALAIDGSTVVVSAPGEVYSLANPTAVGAVYVYELE